MRLVKCELIEYGNAFYLLFKDKRKVKVGDRVLTPNTPRIEKVISLLQGYERAGFCTTTNAGSSSSWLANILSKVAATEDEIASDDFEKLKRAKSAFLVEENGDILRKDGLVQINFEEAVR